MTYRVNGERVSLAEFRRRARKVEPLQSGDSFNVFTEFAPFVSPVNGDYIDSKQKLKEHEKVNKVVQVGDSFDSQINKMKQTKKE